jgi:hypothetical protein
MATGEIALIELTDDGVPDDKPEPETAPGREGDRKPNQGAAPADPARPSQAAENHGFPYFDFYPYGYLY